MCDIGRASPDCVRQYTHRIRTESGSYFDSLRVEMSRIGLDPNDVTVADFYEDDDYLMVAIILDRNHDVWMLEINDEIDNDHPEVHHVRIDSPQKRKLWAKSLRSARRVQQAEHN